MSKFAIIIAKFGFRTNIPLYHELKNYLLNSSQALLPKTTHGVHNKVERNLLLQRLGVKKAYNAGSN